SAAPIHSPPAKVSNADHNHRYSTSRVSQNFAGLVLCLKLLKRDMRVHRRDQMIQPSARLIGSRPGSRSMLRAQTAESFVCASALAFCTTPPCAYMAPRRDPIAHHRPKYRPTDIMDLYHV